MGFLTPLRRYLGTKYIRLRNFSTSYPRKMPTATRPPKAPKIEESPFSHPWSEDFWGQAAPKGVDEDILITISSVIRKKPDWVTKFQNPEIAAKWKDELEQQATNCLDFNAIYEYALKELQWYKEQEEGELAQSGFKYSVNEQVLYSDTAISEATKNSLKEQEQKFEASIEKDYHPNSNNMVVDVVHPSLYPIVYGRTQELVDGEVQTVEYLDEIKKVKKFVPDTGASKTFQWLPAKMTFDKDSQSFTFVSYINNLHPIQFAELYTQISDVFNQSLPGLKRCLSHAVSETYTRIDIPEGHEAYEQEYYDLRDKIYDADDLSAEEECDLEEELEKKKASLVKKISPVWEGGPTLKPFDFSYFGNLNVIVKLANIELTPENPKYDGGSWHVEGTINEDIVATVLYYYDVENIDDSKLSFRESMADPRYEQGDEYFCQHYYGLLDGDIMVRSRGSEVTKQDRVLIFPNVFQHHVDAFELADKSKPGHRKILCFFVVDPYNKLVKSSETILPQQEDWANDSELMNKYFPGINGQSTMTRAEALDYREKLMAERSAAVAAELEDDFSAFHRTFSLCEH